MKKLIFLLFISFSFFEVRAQTKFGLTAGLHSSNLNSLTSYGLKSKSATFFHGGIIVDWKIPASRFHLQGQALYACYGYKNSNILAIDKEGNDIGNIGHEKIGYVQIPAYILYGFGDPLIKFKIGLGPYLALKTNETTKIAQGGDLFRNVLFPAGTRGPASVLTGMGLYGGVELHTIFMALQYQRSFNNIYINNNSANTKWKVTSIGFSLGFFLK